MVKMSFSGSDSEQYLNVEPPGINSSEAESVSSIDVW
jgi:hypothetical protein